MKFFFILFFKKQFLIGIDGFQVLTTKKGRSLGHGIVQFANPTSAAVAVERLHKQELDGRVITVREYFEK